MLCRKRGVTTVVALTAFSVSLALGCFGCTSARQVCLPGGNCQNANEGSGALSLADSTWDFYEASAPAQATIFLTAKFGPVGELESFENATMFEAVGLPAILFDNNRHDITVQGAPSGVQVQYQAAAFGAETDTGDGVGFTASVKLFAVISVGELILEASATFDASDPTIMRGTFTASGNMLGTAIPDEVIPFEAQRRP